MVPGLDRRVLVEWMRRIDTGPFSSLAIGERIAFPNHGRAQMDTYVRRYLGYFGDQRASAIARGISATSAGAIRDAIVRIAGLGADELILVPTSADLEELDRLCDLVASFA